MGQIQITKKQHDDIAAFYDLLKSNSGVIEAFFLKPDGSRKTEYFDNKESFIQSVVLHNNNKYTAYCGLQPRRSSLLKTDRSATADDVTALRLLAVDLDACKPYDDAGNKQKVNATEQEKQACLDATKKIIAELTNGSMAYHQPILMDSGSGCWLYMPIPEIPINDSNRREMAVRLKTWGMRFKKKFQQAGIEIDDSIFEIYRLTKIAGTSVFSYPEEPDRPQPVSCFLSDPTARPDEKLRTDFLSIPVEIPPEQQRVSSHVGGTYRNIDRIFDRCYLMKFLASKGASCVSMPHNIRLALSTFSLALGDLKNNLDFIRRIIGGCPDFSEAKTRRYLELNKDKSAPYGCDAMRELVKHHFKDFDVLQCECALPVSHDQTGRQRKPSPIRFAGIMPEDLTDLFSGLELSGDPFPDFLKMKSFAEGPLADVDAVTAKNFFETVQENVKINKQTVNDLLKARKTAAEEKVTQAQCLITLAKDAEFFRSPDDQIYTSFPVDAHMETAALKTSKFRNWLKRKYYLETGKPPSAQPFQDCLGVLESKGMFEGGVYPVFTRIAGHEDNIYIDLGNDKCEAIEITPTGWNVVQKYPVRFRRARGMGSLPYPVKGDINLLKKYINLANDDDFKMIVAWLIGAMRPKGPYPDLVFTGEAGAAKSTTSEILKKTLDPASSPLRALPENARDLMIAGNNNWILAFDNVSNLSNWLSDALCRLSTGGGFSTRELYSDDGEVIFNMERAVILNGIEDLIGKHDLADRSIIVSMAPIPEKKKKTKNKLWKDFDTDHAAILGGLCDAVSCGLKNIQNVNLDSMTRMADFCEWISAAEPALPWEKGEFMEAYRRNIKEVVSQTVDADAVATAVKNYINDEDTPNSFEGTPSKFLKTLSDYVSEQVSKSKAWPKGAHILTGRLRRAATSLRIFGIEVETGFRLPDKQRGVRIKSASNASQTQKEETTLEALPIYANNNQINSDVSEHGGNGTAGDPSFAAHSRSGDKSYKVEI